MQFINIGFGNLISAQRLIAVVSPDSAPVKRLVQAAKDNGTAVDATQGRKTKGVIITDTEKIVLSALLPETIAGRCEDREAKRQWEVKNEK